LLMASFLAGGDPAPAPIRDASGGWRWGTSPPPALLLRYFSVRPGTDAGCRGPPCGGPPARRLESGAGLRYFSLQSSPSRITLEQYKKNNPCGLRRPASCPRRICPDPALQPDGEREATMRVIGRGGLPQGQSPIIKPTRPFCAKGLITYDLTRSFVPRPEPPAPVNPLQAPLAPRPRPVVRLLERSARFKTIHERVHSRCHFENKKKRPNGFRRRVAAGRLKHKRRPLHGPISPQADSWSLLFFHFHRIGAPRLLNRQPAVVAGFAPSAGLTRHLRWPLPFHFFPGHTASSSEPGRISQSCCVANNEWPPAANIWHLNAGEINAAKRNGAKAGGDRPSGGCVFRQLSPPPRNLHLGPVRAPARDVGAVCPGPRSAVGAGKRL